MINLLENFLGNSSERIHMKESDEKIRLKFIDHAKVFALVLVILSHTSYISFMSWANLFFIPIFFVCAGYTSSLNFKIKSKVKKLLKPYLILNIMLFIYFSVRNLKIYIIPFLKTAYSRYCLWPYGTPNNLDFFVLDNGPMWFLTALFTSYLFFKLILNIKSKYQPIVVLGFLVLSWSFQYLPILLPWSLDTAPLFASYMWIGSFLREREKRISFILDKNIIIITFIIIYFIISYFVGEVNLSVRIYGNNYILAFFGGISGSILTIALFKKITPYIKTGSLVLIISKYSIIIFSLQFLFIRFTSNVCTNLPFPDPLLAIIQLITAITGGIIIGIFLRKGGKILFKQDFL